LVTATAGRLDHRRAGRAAAVVDRLIGGLPAPVSRKLVALAVEAAGIAGYRACDQTPGNA
jgi:hypothetical protein